MSQENLELVERALTAATARPDPDYDTINQLYSDDHVFRPVGVEVGIEEEAEGVGGYRAWQEALQEDFANTSHEIHGVIDVGPQKVLAVSTTSYEGKTSGIAADQRIWSVMTLRGEKIARTEAFTDPLKALEAAGLSE